MNRAIELLEAAGTRFGERVVTHGLDALLLLPVVLLLHLALRRHASSHVRAALPWLLVVPLLVPIAAPLDGWLPEAVRPLAWRTWIDCATASAPVAGDAPAGEAIDPEPTARSAARTAVDDLLALALRGGTAPPAVTLSSTESSGIPIAVRDAGISAAALAFVAWLAVVLTAACQWWLRARRWRAVLAEARALPPAELGAAARTLVRHAAARGIAIREHDRLPAPIAVGLLRPTVLLPSELRRTLPDDGLRFVLLHELAHVRRRDLWAGLLLRLVRLAWFFHPAPWIAGRWFERAREEACDDAALAQFAPPERPACAEAFLQVVEFSRHARADLSGAAAMAGEVTEARSRIMRMVDERDAVPSGITRGGRIALAAGALLLVALQQPASSAVQQIREPSIGAGAPADPPAIGPASATPAAQDAAAAPRSAAPLDRDERMRKSKSAVLDAARWLALHQSSNGYWDSDGFGRDCRECSDKGQPLNDIGVTALAVMALIEALRLGDTQVAPQLDKASAYLLSIQDSDDGCLGAKAGQHFMYGHVLATLALGKLEARQREPARGKALQAAVDFIARARNPYKAWRYAYPPDGDNDASTTAFALLALEQAMEAGIAVDARSVDDGGKYLDAMRDPTNGRVGYHERGSLSAREPDDMDLWPADQVEAITAAALHVATAQGRALEDDPMLRAGVNLLHHKLPQWNDRTGTIDYYYWFHGTAALEPLRDPIWRSWQEAVWAALLPNQRTKGHVGGSFDAAPDPWGDNGGRVYATAINALTLARTIETPATHSPPPDRGR